jgi:hypothetical protein
VKQPDLIIEDLLNLGESLHKGAGDELRRAESQLGIRFRDDIAASLGNDVTIAVDGALIPPSWKFIVEVKDPARIQQVIEKLVAEYNRMAKEEKRPEIITRGQRLDGRTATDLSFGEGGMTISYAFSEGYLIVAADPGTLRRALRVKDNGNRIRLGRYLTADQYPNFSAVVYHDLSRVGTTITDALNAAGSLTPEQRAQAEKLAAQARPGLIYAYAENDRIRLTSTGGIFGLTLESLFSAGGIADLLKQGTGLQRPGSGLRRGPERAEMRLLPFGVPPRPPIAPRAPRPDLSRDREGALEAQRNAEQARKQAEQLRNELRKAK